MPLIEIELAKIREVVEKLQAENTRIGEEAGRIINTVLETLAAYPTRNTSKIPITDTEYLRFDGSRILIGSVVGPGHEDNIRGLPAVDRLALCEYFPAYLEKYRQGLR